jgi:hypothetical protein
MAIIYSYPLADEVTNDSWVLGSEMDNGQRVVKNYSIGDIAAFIQGQSTNTPTLQEVASEGNTVSGGLSINVNNGQYHTSLEGVSVNVSNSSNVLTLYAASVVFEKQFGTGAVELRFPNTIDGNRTIEFPNASGTIALTSDLTAPTLQEVVSEGNTVTGGASIDVVNGSNETIINAGYINVIGSSNVVSISPDNIFFEKQLGSGSVELSFPNTIGTARSIEFPDASGTMALVEDIPTPAYRVYTALINQTGTAAPFVNSVLENTLGGTVTFEYTNPGLYYAVLTGEFTANKTTAMLWGGTGAQLFKAAPISFDRVLLVTYNTSGVPANDQMGITTLEIRVYN